LRRSRHAYPERDAVRSSAPLLFQKFSTTSRANIPLKDGVNDLAVLALCSGTQKGKLYANPTLRTIMMFSVTKLLAASLLLSAALAQASINNEGVAAVAQQEEQALKARIGIVVIDTGAESVASYRGNERFPLNSTHKALLCGALLSAQDKGKLRLTERTQFDRTALVTYSPVTEKFVAPAEMSWGQLCEAAIGYSDNTAANLLAKKLGGARGGDAFFRRSGRQGHTARPLRA